MLVFEMDTLKNWRTRYIKFLNRLRNFPFEFQIPNEENRKEKDL